MSSSNNTSEKNLGYLYAVFGGLAFFAAIAFAICNTYQIYTTNFDTVSLKNDATQQALALPLFFTSIAGMFYVLYNLDLQRKTLLAQIESNKQNVDEFRQQVIEAKDSNKHFEKQNETLINQQSDNTFFNLIDLHKKLLNETNAQSILAEARKLSSIYLEKYTEHLDNKKFQTLFQTQSNPAYRFAFEKNNVTDIIQMFIINSKTIINFIDTRLHHNAEFYHSVFYNNLTNKEKYFLGLFFEFELFGLKKNSIFQYELYFRNESKFTSDYGFFPAIDSNFITNRIPEHLYIQFSNILSIKSLSPIPVKGFNLDFVTIKVSELKLFKVNIEKEFFDTQVINLRDVFEYVFSELTTGRNYSLNLEYNFLHGKTAYVVYDKKNFQLLASKEILFSDFNINIIVNSQTTEI